MCECSVSFYFLTSLFRFDFSLFIFVDLDVVLSNEYGSQVRNSLFRIVRGGWVIYVKLVRSSVCSFVR